jgi:hypothetical protein
MALFACQLKRDIREDTIGAHFWALAGVSSILLDQQLAPADSERLIGEHSIIALIDRYSTFRELTVVCKIIATMFCLNIPEVEPFLGIVCAVLAEAEPDNKLCEVCQSLKEIVESGYPGIAGILAEKEVVQIVCRLIGGGSSELKEIAGAILGKLFRYHEESQELFEQLLDGECVKAIFELIEADLLEVDQEEPTWEELLDGLNLLFRYTESAGTTAELCGFIESIGGLEILGEWAGRGGCNSRRVAMSQVVLSDLETILGENQNPKCPET